LKICMISGADRAEPYGSTIRPLSLEKKLVSLGFEVLHICRKDLFPEKNMQRFSFQEFAGKSRKRKFKIIYERCRHFSPDVIYTHQIVAGNLGIRLRHRLNTPHVYDAHSSIALELPTYTHLSLKNRLWLLLNEKSISKLAHKVVVPSSELRDFMIRRYHLHPNKMAIVKNGVETDVFQPSKPDMALKRELGISDAKTIIGFTNPRQLTFPSNEIALRNFFKAVPELEKRSAGIKFLIIGGGPEVKAPSKNVIYTGFVKDLPAYISLADICVAPFPSQAVCGGTRLKVCEYLACGKPIVATEEAMRGFDDAIPGKHFLLARNHENFIDQILYCLSNPEEAEKLGKNARTLAERYDWRHLAVGLAEILGSVR